MVSVQVQRFQKRIWNLKSHHDMCSLRYSEAVNNYISNNYDIMNSLITYLKSDKNSKKPKRLPKLRKYSEKPSTFNSLTHDFASTSFVSQMLDLPRTGVDDNLNECQISSESKEPIFPSPYAEPTFQTFYTPFSMYDYEQHERRPNLSSTFDIKTEISTSLHSTDYGPISYHDDEQLGIYEESKQYANFIDKYHSSSLDLHNNNSNSNNNNNNNNNTSHWNEQLNCTYNSSVGLGFPSHYSSSTTYSNVNNNFSYADAFSHSKNASTEGFCYNQQPSAFNVYNSSTTRLKDSVNPILVSTYPPAYAQKTTNLTDNYNTSQEYHYFSQYTSNTNTAKCNFDCLSNQNCLLT